MTRDPPPAASAQGRQMWHTASPDEVLARIESSRHGLDGAEAARRLVRYGPNTLPEAASPGILTVFARQFASPFIYVLLAAIGLSIILREWADAGFIGVVVVLNAVIGTVQEARAQRSAQALRQMATTRARVVRDGDVSEIDAEELVPGDVVLLSSGDKVPADVRLLSSQELHVDESLLTGESLPVGKDARQVVAAEIGIADRINMAFAGTLVNRGRADAVVVATASVTALGTLATELTSLHEQEPPLLLRMRRFTHWVAALIAIVAVAFGVVEAARGTPLTEVALVAIALAVSAIPEGLPVALTVALAIAMRRMVRRHVIVRRMAAVEALGSCTTIASDKTGTLTINELTASVVVLPNGSRWMASGTGTDPEGGILPADLRDEPYRGQVMRLAVSSTLCNEAVLAHSDGGWIHHGDAVDVGLLILAHRMGITQSEAVAVEPRIADLPFESERRYAASLHRRLDGDGSARISVHIKGAAEAVLAMCGWQQASNGDVPLQPQDALGEAERLAGEGYRVIAVAADERRSDGDTPRLEDSQLRDLTWLGMVGMLDPPRRTASAAVAACRDAGLRVLMITGDHPSTALAVAGQVGIAAAREAVVTGSDLRRAVDGDAAEASTASVDAMVSTGSVFARIEPAQKLTIVESLIRQGEFVAVTGDGANDAPALRQAHVGVAMGAAGTDVAREAADLIITDDDFSSIVAGVEEGRVAYANVRKVISLLISTGAAEVVLFLLALAIGLPPPLTAVQLLWLNLVTNGIQDVALAFEPAEGDEMRRPPRPPAEPVFDRLMIERVLVSALAMGATALVTYRVMLGAGWGVDAARNGVMALMVLFENVMVLNARSETTSLLRRGLGGNRLLILGTLAALGLHIGAMHFWVSEDVLQIAPLAPAVWGILVGTALGLMVVIEAHKASWRWRTQRHRRRPGEPRGTAAGRGDAEAPSASPA